MRYLARADVIEAAARVDAVQVVREALLLHAAGDTTLPAEAYLPWHTADGAFARSLALPGALWGTEPALGTKLINSSLANPDRGLPRAQGLIVLHDRETAHPVAIMEAAYISALRTSAYTALSVQVLGPPTVVKVAVIGCGELARAHLRLLDASCPGAWFAVHDEQRSRSDALAAAMRREGIDCRVAAGARDATDGASVVVTVTTTTTGYLPHEWLSPGALVAHVSLDDVLPDVVARADLLVVDDWPLISADDRRLLGRMYRAGELAGPGGEVFDPAARPPGARRVSASLADVLSGQHPGRQSPEQVVLSNPFGMGILDVAVALRVLRSAQSAGTGLLLPV
jgi:ornithine cyclodeaminase